MVNLIEIDNMVVSYEEKRGLFFEELQSRKNKIASSDNSDDLTKILDLENIYRSYDNKIFNIGMLLTACIDMKWDENISDGYNDAIQDKYEQIVKEYMSIFDEAINFYENAFK